MKNTISFKYIISILIFILIVILLILSIHVNTPTQVSVITRLGNISGSQGAGLFLTIPLIDNVTTYDTTIQSVECITGVGKSNCNALDAATKDLQNVKVAVQVSYKVDPKDVISLYKLIQDQSTFSNIIVPSAIEESMKATTAKYTAEELIQKRNDVGFELEKILSEKIGIYSLDLVNLNITNFDFSDAFKKAIDEKTVVQQEIQTRKSELEKAAIEAQIKQTQAEGEAKAIEIQNRALQQNVGYLELKKIEKWNGVLPLYYGNAGTNTIFNIPERKSTP